MNPIISVIIPVYKVEENYNLEIPSMDNYENKIVLLTGATGYLGIYILNRLLTQTNSKIVILGRSRLNLSVRERIEKNYKYFFDDNLESFSDRLEIYESDLSKNRFNLNEEIYNSISESVDVVINAAAKVQHFGDWTSFKESNIDSLCNIINFCKTNKGKKLVHISTASVVSGCEDSVFNEKTINLHSDLKMNLYTKSKIEAEKVLINSDFTDWCIMRIGNVCFDSINGKFQQDWQQNAFLARLNAFVKNRIIPEGILYNEYSFVNNIADAILLLSEIHKQQSIYHVWNPNIELFDESVKNDNDIKIISPKSFLDNIKLDISNGKISNYKDLLVHLHVEELESNHFSSNQYTEAILKKLNFHWDPMNNKLRKNLLINLEKGI